ncbi:hypothetical protein LP117_08980 [Moraxella bovis]|uniref:hypothetical protein n=1 Tax=Moraxella bovis TaxID=476 RepID=UPI002227209F|nr:hypothetical protein [Moraxella bovis]UZA23914.1 hypothetical protein LP117_08980 [Moraxella bovis]UZA30167.1 hypothetical protein LP097_00385 [Moraxella bovis]
MKKPLIILSFLATLAHANTQMYVIHTYGDPALLDIIQDELGNRGTARLYQDKLIIKATPADYERISALVRQVDVAPTRLNISLALNNQTAQSSQGGHVNVGISRQVWINGQYHNTQSQSTTNQHYTVQTLSGSPVSITQSTLIGLVGGQAHQRYGRVWVNFGASWVALTDGFSAKATVSPNGQIRLSLHQSARTGTLSIQNLSNDIMLHRGQWTKIGDIRTDNTTRGSYGTSQYSQTMPIWVRVD